MRTKIIAITVFIVSLLFFLGQEIQNAGTFPVNDDIPEFPVHFTVLKGSTQVIEAAIKEVLTREVDLMNRYFVDNKGRPLAKFFFHSISFYDDIRDSKCEILKPANRDVDTLTWINKVFTCRDSRIFDPRAVNVLIVDWYSGQHGYASAISFGGASIILPAAFVALDWIYLTMPEAQSLRTHELGHALGALGHECIPGDIEACPDGPAGENKSVMGKGTQFSSKQAEIIHKHLHGVRVLISRMKPRSSIENGSFEVEEKGIGFHYWQGFSHSKKSIYLTSMRGSPGISGKVAAIVPEGDELYQWIELDETGKYDIQVQARTDGLGGEFGVIVNGIKSKSLPVAPGERSKIRQPWLSETGYKTYRIPELRLNKSDLIRVYVLAGSKKMVIDDFTMTKSK